MRSGVIKIFNTSVMKPVAHNKHEARKGTQAEITHAVLQQATAQARRQEMKWGGVFFC